MSTGRAIWVREGRLRHGRTNPGTVLLAEVGALAPFFFRERFTRHYSSIRELMGVCARPGLLAVALDHQGFAAAAFFGAKEQEINTAVIGRHTRADLFLDEDPALSLRHLLLLLQPRPSAGEPRFRVLDLRTGTRFADERGRRLDAIEAESPAFLSCGRYGIYLFPTGDGLPWPEDARDGWACIPERVPLGEQGAGPGRRCAPVFPPAPPQPRTIFRDVKFGHTTRVIDGPAPARQEMVRSGEDPIGALQIESDEGRAVIVLGPNAARRGVLLGRAERCDNSSLRVLCSDHISRVHVLVIEVGGRLYAVDTASSFGMFRDGYAVRVAPLDYGVEVALNDPGGPRVRWTPVN